MTTPNELGHYLELSDIDGNWDYGEDVIDRNHFQGVKFFPGAPGDVLIVREGSITGPRITKLVSSDGEGRGDMDIGKTSRPNIKLSECTFSSGAFVTFVYEDYETA